MIDIDRNNSQIDKIISKSSHFNPNYFLSYSQRKTIVIIHFQILISEDMMEKEFQ